MRRLIFSFLFILTVGFVAASTSLAIMIGFDPSSQIINVGGQFSIDVVVSDLGDQVVSAYDLDINYDATILAATSISFGTGLDGGSFMSFQDFDISTPGLVDFREVSLLSDAELLLSQPNSFSLATLSFDVLSLGSTSLTFAFNDLNKILGLQNQILSPVVGTGNVAAVPIPATIFLLATGLAGLAGFRKKFKKK